MNSALEIQYKHSMNEFGPGLSLNISLPNVWEPFKIKQAGWYKPHTERIIIST